MLSSKERKIIEICCKKTILDIVVESPYLRENLSFRKQADMMVWVKDLSYEQAVSAVFNNGKLLNEIGIRQFENKFKKFIKYGLVAAAGVFGGPAGPPVAMFAYYLFRKMSDPCEQKCILKFGHNSKICKKQCLVDACTKMLSQIKISMERCDQAKNPKSCKRKLTSLHKEWSKKLAKYNAQLTKAKAKKLKKTGNI